MAKEKESKVNNENKRFMKDVKSELKRVTWPTSKQMVSNVTAVIAIVIVTAVIVFVLDIVFSAMNKYGLDKLKQKVQSNNQSQVISSVTDEEQAQNSTDESSDAENTADTEQVENTETTENADVE